jgi:EAL domain-containing protein (putative c-di-GMP-specific phosphodiesterase class I)
VTESSLIQRHANVKKQLDLLKELGVFLALDDFGTGYASLSYLQEYPFDFIKIDKSFITNIETDRTQHAIVKAILDLAVALDMQVIAEGIETEEQRDVLLAMDCQYGQGYWFGKPVTADVATEMLIQQDATK